MATTRVMRTLSIYRQEGKEGVIWDKTGAVGEAASQSYKVGAPLVYAAGTIKVWDGDDTDKIIGVAMKDATGVTGAAVPYYEANDYNLFEGSLINNATAHVLAVGDIGAVYALVASSTSWYVDITNTYNQVVIVGCIDPIGDTNARIIFRFLGGMQSRVLQS